MHARPSFRNWVIALFPSLVRDHSDVLRYGGARFPIDHYQRRLWADSGPRLYMYVCWVSATIHVICHQWRSKNAEKVTHIKGRLLEQPVILFNCVSFQNENFSKRKEFAPRGSEVFPLRVVPYGMDNHLNHIR